ncbi:hypothetical protein HYV88_05210 [Candidatus Woesearchaeota archaeon]|nr:hypothetical protein [Candidatus Woesearchaeota archaeon]
MFKWYGLVGILIIVLMEINFFFKIQPFASWYFPIIWIGYILVLDAINKKISGKSLISDNKNNFFGILIISALFWWVFEFTNLSVHNWGYIGIMGDLRLRNLFGLLSFATVLPAFFETYELIRNIHLFDKLKLKKKHDITKRFLHTMMVIGIIFFILPLLFPKLAFPLVWLSFYFILDPINYLHKQPSIIKHIKDRNLAIPLSLLLAGIIMGFFWEFWNFYALPKWTYNIPFVSFFKIFEMPLLGYLGYFPFAFELYVMYFFVQSLFLRRDKLLAN